MQFGTKFDDLTSTLAKAASLADQAERNKLYAQANNLIMQHVPMVPIAHGGSAVAYKATVDGAYASPLGNEQFAVDGRYPARIPSCGCRTPSRSACTARMRPMANAARLRADLRIAAVYKRGGTKSSRVWPKCPRRMPI